MRSYKQGRFSGYLRPLSYIVDLSAINGLALLYFFKGIEPLVFAPVVSVAWIVLSLYSQFYEVYRFTREATIASLIFKQAAMFVVILLAFTGVYKRFDPEIKTIFTYVLSVFLLIALFKFAVYFLLQRYRKVLGGNFRRTVIFGKNAKTGSLEEFFNKNPEYGYVHKKTFNFNGTTDLEGYFSYIIKENIDEIYCSISELSNEQLNQVVDFADNNLKILKFLPDNREILSKKLKYQYYDYLPILSFRNIPLEEPINTFVKRLFDIVFAVFIIVFVLSWLTPILALAIKLDSKGPVFFKQLRYGFNYQEFYCYKFRSMMPNKEAHLNQATKDDQRVTRMGKFLRKTSIDELPQFFNVLFGDMSVVGPRPHMLSHSNMYAERVDKFMVRHFVKPGITGLAQVSGFRGEVETESDIINRVKYDIFYVENWSLLLDLKIVFQTLFNAIKGEDKAY